MGLNMLCLTPFFIQGEYNIACLSICWVCGVIKLFSLGKVNIFDADGNELDVTKEVIALCRCANLSNKPFCDGSHVTI